MKKTLCFCMVFFLLMSGVCNGAIVLDDGLVLQDGKERIEMKVGERVYLKVQSSIWKYPLLRNLEFSSKNPLVAYADTYGWIHAQAVGRTVISVWNDRGANGTIEVIVRGKKEIPTWLTALIFALFFLFLTMFLMPWKFVVLNEILNQKLCRLTKYFLF